MKHDLSAVGNEDCESRPAGARGLKQKLNIEGWKIHARRAPQGRVD